MTTTEEEVGETVGAEPPRSVEDWPARLLRAGPWILVALAVGFGLVALRAELTPARYLNDESLHFSMVRWASYRIQTGHLPFDGWYPYFNLGLPQFHHYQSLPHIVTAYVGLIIGIGTAFRLAGYLLLAFFPLSVYWGARLLGWQRWTAGACALLTPLLVSTTSYGFEHSSYAWIGGGLWSQEWGMWLLPLAWGFGWRAVRGKGSLALGALAVGLTVALHFLTGYLALLSVVAWVLLARQGFFWSLVRAALVGAGALATASWVVVPLLLDSRWSNRSEFNQHTYWYDSFGARKVLGWLLTGKIYDAGRAPIISLLVAVGLVVCIQRSRRDERAKAVLAMWIISLVLFFGRPTLGPLLSLLPGTGDMQLHRYIMGVHLAGLLLAGVGGVWLAEWFFKALRRAMRREVISAGPALVWSAVGLIGLVALAPAVKDRLNYDHSDASLIAAQQAADRTDGADLDALVQEAKARGSGRMYAGLPTNWGQTYKVGSVPVYAELADDDADTLGFNLRTVSLSADIEPYFNDAVPAQYDLFDVRYLFLPAPMKPPVPATLIDQRGRHTLWEVKTSGYFEVVDTSGTVAADRSSMAAQLLPWLDSAQPGEHLFPTVAFAGAPPAPTSVGSGPIPTGVAGSVDTEVALPADGTFSAQVTLTRPAVVLLKTTFDPRWSVTVDGLKATAFMIAPSFVGVGVPAGEHAIGFVYQPYPSYTWLFLLGLLSVAGLALGQLKWRTGSGESGHAVQAAAK